MEEFNPKLSIVTPTYNRGGLLNNCYRSLLKQTNRNFEWIIVDDGSVDDTQEIAKGFQSGLFPIVYVKKENGGKHTALNASHPYIRGNFVLILDSDDTLTETAVEEVLLHWEKFQDDASVGVITFLRATPDGRPFCAVKNYEVPVDMQTYPRIVYLGNDCCEVIRADLFLKYPFPGFKGERFLSEGVLWNRVARTHKCVYIDKAIYLCEYLEDGLTKAGRAMRIHNPRGGMLSSSLGMERRCGFRCRIKSGLLYCCYGFFAGLKMCDIVGKTKNKTISVICMLPGYLLYRYWKAKYW